ncbi:MAG TPA: VTT domain-containing protein [Myxococcota bacterium]|nr:VTT domain-containing protein [Myxococcota bacterium]
MLDTVKVAPSRVRVSAAVALLLVAVLAVGAGQEFRASAGIELSPESLRTWVQQLGPLAPLVFFGMVTFRSLLLLPSALVLTAGGLLFGAPLGALVGGAGIFASALWCFAAARLMGREWVQSRIPARLRPLEARAESFGPPLIGLATAHPMGVMTPLYFAAGLSRIRFAPFVAVCAIAGPFRAFLYAWLGAQLVDFGSPRFWAATLLLLVVAVLPLAHPRVRRWLLARGVEPEDR